GITLVLVTHENDVARRAEKIARFNDGKVVNISAKS
ncbi:MAG: macrolide ABC transporter ATP-binding protein, partial [Verrucomicrobiota bacterium]|nr:macrolide ABC transporter ATP-binding protein [Verrucomicrobiota bacterium]